MRSRRAASSDSSSTPLLRNPISTMSSSMTCTCITARSSRRSSHDGVGSQLSATFVSPCLSHNGEALPMLRGGSKEMHIHALDDLALTISISRLTCITFIRSNDGVLTFAESRFQSVHPFCEVRSETQYRSGRRLFPSRGRCNYHGAITECVILLTKLLFAQVILDK